MRACRAFVRLSAVFLAGLGLQVPGAATSETPSAPPPTPPFGVAGKVFDAANRPTGGVRVGVSLVYPHRESLSGATQYLMDDTTDGAGRYAFSATGVSSKILSVLDDYKGSRDDLQLQVVAYHPDELVIYILPLTSPGVGSVLPRASAQPQSLDLRVGVGRTGTEASRGTASTMVAPTRVQRRLSSAAPTTTARAQAAKVTTCRTGYNLYWSATNNYIKRMVPIQVLSTRSKTTATYEWETTEKTQLGVAITGVSSPYSAGLSHSVENATSAGVNAAIGRKTTRMIKVQWSYRQYQGYCLSMGSPNLGGYLIDIYKWSPHHFTTGNRKVPDISDFACVTDYQVPIENETWVARSSTATWVAWFAIGGAKLDSSQTSSTSHRITYTPHNRATLCGYGADPGLAAFVREKE